MGISQTGLGYKDNFHVKSLQVNKNFQTCLLVDWRQSRQPATSHVTNHCLTTWILTWIVLSIPSTGMMSRMPSTRWFCRYWSHNYIDWPSFAFCYPLCCSAGVFMAAMFLALEIIHTCRGHITFLGDIWHVTILDCPLATLWYSFVWMSTQLIGQHLCGVYLIEMFMSSKMYFPNRTNIFCCPRYNYPYIT